MLQFLEDLLLHELSLKQSLRILLRYDFYGNILLRLVVDGIDYYSEGSYTEQPFYLVKNREFRLTIPYFDLYFLYVIDSKLRFQIFMNLFYYQRVTLVLERLFLNNFGAVITLIFYKVSGGVWLKALFEIFILFVVHWN